MRRALMTKNAPAGACSIHAERVAVGRSYSEGPSGAFTFTQTIGDTALQANALCRSACQTAGGAAGKWREIIGRAVFSNRVLQTAQIQ